MRRPVRKRILFAVSVVVVLLGLVALELHRGHVSGPIPAPPLRREEGTRVALVDQVGGRKAVWCSRVVGTDLPRVLGVVTDYSSYPSIFGGFESVSATRETGGRQHLRGIVRVLGMSVPLEIDLFLEEGPGRASVHWDGSSEALPVNRGSWTLETVADGTRITYLLDLEARSFPAMAVRAFLLHQVAPVVEAVATEALRRGEGGA